MSIILGFLFWMWTVIAVAAFLKPLVARFVLRRRGKIRMMPLAVVAIFEMLVLSPLGFFLAGSALRIPITYPSADFQHTMYPQVENVLEFYDTVLNAAMAIFLGGIPLNMLMLWLEGQDLNMLLLWMVRLCGSPDPSFGGGKPRHKGKRAGSHLFRAELEDPNFAEAFNWRNIRDSTILSLVTLVVCISMVGLMHLGGADGVSRVKAREYGFNKDNCVKGRTLKPPIPRLTDAVISGDVDLIEELLAEGNSGFTPRELTIQLSLACGDGHPGAARTLIAHGADDNGTSDHHYVPLEAAASAGNEAIVGLLLDKGADVFAKDDAGATALWYAYLHCDMRIVKLLEAHGLKQG